MTTTITLPRAVVEQALEAMRCVWPTAKITLADVFKVESDLRAALAQQAESVEPVDADAAYQRWLEDTHAPALRRMDSRGAFSAGWQAAALAQQAEPVQEPDYWQEEARRYAGNADYWRKRYEALAEPQEPVAWIQPDHLQKARRAPFLSRVEPTQRCADFVPLYTAPPQRKPLSGIQVERLLEQVIGSLPVARNLVRAVEAAHGIGGSDD